MFYLAFPIICKIARPPILAVGLFAAVYFYGPYDRMNEFTLWGYFGCFDTLALGVLVALAAPTQACRQGLRYARYALAALGLSLVLICFLGAKVTDNAVWGPTIVGLGTAMLLLSSGGPNEGPRHRWFLVLTAPLATIGRYSYECYLLHAAGIIAVRSWFGGWGDRPYLYLLVTFGGVLIVSVGVGRYFAEPTNRRLRRLLTTWLTRTAALNREYRPDLGRARRPTGRPF